MDNFKLVSVIITTYKKATYLNRAINSILKQTYKNIEIIVVDDNDESSEDRKNTELIMLKYSTNSKINYIKHKKNLNGAAARNTGIAHSSGDYIAFLDDDDIFNENRINTLVCELEKEENRKYGGAYTDLKLVMKNSTILFSDKYHCKSGNMHYEALCLNFSLGSGSNMFFRREILQQLGGFDVNFKRHQDLEFIIRYFCISDLLYIDDVLATKYMDIDIIRFNSYILEDVKKIFLTKFKQDINSYSVAQRNLIYTNHMKELLDSFLYDLRIRKSIELIYRLRNNLVIYDYVRYFKIIFKVLAKSVLKYN